MSFDVYKVRENFPVLQRKINGKDLIYFDNAATTLKPVSVVNRISQHYLYESSNVHRGLHYLSDLATENFEKARKKVQNYIDAKDLEEVVFTRGTTDSLNLAAMSLGETFLQEGDEVLVSEIEHHSNIVPWHILAKKMGAKVTSFKVNDNGEVDIEDFKSRLTDKVKIVSFTAASNTLGVQFPIKKMTELAHQNNSIVIIDAAQIVAHQKISVQELNCDFLAFSGHKIYGPTGIGVLYGKSKYLEAMSPVVGGGGMIDEVSLDSFTYLKAPFRFEAGTPHIAGIIGLGEALDYISSFEMKEIRHHELTLTHYAQNKLKEIPGVDVFSALEEKAPVVSFFVKGCHPFDIGSLLDQDGVAVRCGHHCTQPLMKKLKIPGTIRSSFALYNTKEEVDLFTNSLLKALHILG